MTFVDDFRQFYFIAVNSYNCIATLFQYRSFQAPLNAYFPLRVEGSFQYQWCNYSSACCLYKIFFVRFSRSKSEVFPHVVSKSSAIQLSFYRRSLFRRLHHFCDWCLGLVSAHTSYVYLGVWPAYMVSFSLVSFGACERSTLTAASFSTTAPYANWQI